MDGLDPALLDELAGFSSPSIANGIETFDVRPRQTGYADGTVRCMFPELGTVVGYAATATIRAREPGPPSADRDLWAHVSAMPAPRLVVVQDLDDPPASGSYWGEVNSTIYRAFGAVGVVTNGCVRDLDEMRSKPFHAFASGVCVSHANVHVVEAGIPVEVGGLTVHPGDLLLGDQHGVVSIPPQIAAALPAAVREVERKERGVIELFSSPEFSPESMLGSAPEH